MQIQLIRNASLRVTYSGHLFLVDPFLAGKHQIESFAGISPNPLVALPCSPEEVIQDIEMVIMSHLHMDHFDKLARNMLPKDLPVFCQPGDEQTLTNKGFGQVTPIEDTTTWEGSPSPAPQGGTEPVNGANRWARYPDSYFRQKTNQPSIDAGTWSCMRQLHR